MSLYSEPSGNEKFFANADSFAMAFDDAWKRLNLDKNLSQKEKEEKIQLVLQEIDEHPFKKKYPLEASKVAEFRIRLLKLS